MRLEIRSPYVLKRTQPEHFLTTWTIDVVASTDPQDPDSHGELPVGRIVAKEMRRSDIDSPEEPTEEELEDDNYGGPWGVWEVLDFDASGFCSAWAKLVDEEGDFREQEFGRHRDPIIYLETFLLHEDFNAWRMPVMSAFCRRFPAEALILVSAITTRSCESEFAQLGFSLLPPSPLKVESWMPEIELDRLVLLRDNRKPVRPINLHPEEAPCAHERHAEWLEKLS